MAALTGCHGESPAFTTRFLTFGTLVDLSIVGVDRARAERAAELVERDFAYMHQAWHAWKPGPLGRANRLIAEKKSFAAPPSIAAATALFLAGPSSWRKVAQRVGIRYVLLVDSEGTVHMNPAMAERVELFAEDVDVALSPPLSQQHPESG